MKLDTSLQPLRFYGADPGPYRRSNPDGADVLEDCPQNSQGSSVTNLRAGLPCPA